MQLVEFPLLSVLCAFQRFFLFCAKHIEPQISVAYQIALNHTCLVLNFDLLFASLFVLFGFNILYEAL